MFKIVQLTDDIFFRFKIEIISNLFLIYVILEENNFELLLDRANRMKLHIHKIIKIKNNENSILYVCSNKCYLDYN